MFIFILLLKCRSVQLKLIICNVNYINLIKEQANIYSNKNYICMDTLRQRKSYIILPENCPKKCERHYLTRNIVYFPNMNTFFEVHINWIENKTKWRHKKQTESMFWEYILVRKGSPKNDITCISLHKLS